MTDLRELAKAALEERKGPYVYPYLRPKLYAFQREADPTVILALLDENERLRKDARCPSEDPATGYRCEFKLGHGCDLHGYETFAWPVLVEENKQ